MRARLVLVMIVALLTVGASSVLADDAPKLRIMSVTHTDDDTMVVVVTAPQVADAESRIRVTENGQLRPSQQRSAALVDVQTVLVIDTTGSMAGAPLADAKDASIGFVDALPPTVDVAAVAYDTVATVIAGFGHTRQDLIAAIAQLQAGGYTAMHDAVVHTSALFDGDVRIMVLLTDGEDNASTATLDDAVRAATDAGVIIHGIEYRTAFTDESSIRQLATATGGSSSVAEDRQAVAAIYNRIMQEVVGMYALEFVPTSTGQTLVGVSMRYDGLELTDSVTVETVLDATNSQQGSPRDEPAVADVSAPVLVTIPAPSGDHRIHPHLALGIAGWFGALLLGSIVVMTTGRRPIAGLRRSQSADHHATSFARHAGGFAERALERHGRLGVVNSRLERTGWPIRAGEWLTLTLCLAVVTFAGLEMAAGWIAGIACALAVVASSWTMVVWRGSRRCGQFAEQLSDVLQMIAGGLRAGYSLMQAIDVVAREADAPASQEFSRIIAEVRLGRDTDAALEGVAARMASEDFSWVAQAIGIHRTVGGDLAELLDTVSTTLRERARLRRQITALTADGRLSAMILVALPFAVAGVVSVTNRDYLAVLVSSGAVGWSLIGISVGLLCVGVLWLRSIIRFDT